MKEFKETDHQMAIIDEFDEQEEWDRDAFNTIIEEKKRIAEGERVPEVHIKDDRYERYVDELEQRMRQAQSYGIENIKTLPRVHYERATKICIGHVAYWLKQLKMIGGQDFVDEVMRRIK